MFCGFGYGLGIQSATGEKGSNKDGQEAGVSGGHDLVLSYLLFISPGRWKARQTAIFAGGVPGGAFRLACSGGETGDAYLSALSRTHSAPSPPSLGGAWQKARTSERCDSQLLTS